MSFYVILFCSLMVASLTHPLNPAATPRLQTDLRSIVLPVSLVFGVGTFVVSLMQGRKRDKLREVVHQEQSNKAAV
jgi:hypothetical protein